MKEAFKNKEIYLTSLVCIIVDQIIKIVVANNVTLYNQITVIKNFFYITNMHNDGGAWSILSGNIIFLVIISFIVIYVIYRFFIKNNNLTFNDKFIYGILYGGIIGNLIDRLFRGYVIDYLDFIIFKYDFPVFNLADSLIIIAIFLLIISMFRGEKNENKSR